MRILSLATCVVALASASCAAGTMLIGDFDGDGIEDRAVLALSVEAASADLIIETADRIFRYADLVFSSVQAGQEPSLAMGPGATLQLRSGNHAVGRNRWDQTLAIAWRDGAFRLVGITRSWWDTLTAGSDGHCEVDLLTGRGMSDSAEGAREIRLEPGAPELETWDRTLPQACLGA